MIYISTVQECDATIDAQGEEAGNKKLQTINLNNGKDF
jgi:hypothetical protein